MAVMLVVDDDRAVRALVRDVLEAEAELWVRVREARDGYDALLRMREERPDLILRVDAGAGAGGGPSDERGAPTACWLVPRTVGWDAGAVAGAVTGYGTAP